MSTHELSGKVVAITGGSRGIGLSIAERLAKLGAKIAIAARNPAEIETAIVAVKKASGSDQHFGFVCDVSDKAQVLKFASSTEDHLGTPYALVAAAGVYGEISPFLESSVDKWQESLDINLMGVVRSVHAFANLMAGNGGRIVLFSGGGQGPLKNFAPYVCAKGALWRFTETVGAELADKKIYMNAIAPGAVNTKFLDDLLAAGPQKAGKEFFEKSLKQRDAGGESPEKAAALVEYLLSRKSEGLYGRTLSAIWDAYQEIENPDAVSKTDLFAYRRVVTPDGGTRPK